jgi:hypothetical protein
MDFQVMTDKISTVCIQPYHIFGLKKNTFPFTLLMRLMMNDGKFMMTYLVGRVCTLLIELLCKEIWERRSKGRLMLLMPNNLVRKNSCAVK